MLEITADLKAKKAYEGVNLECVKDTYAQILSIFVSNISKERSQTTFSTHWGNLLPKSSSFFTNIETLTWVKKRELASQIVATFYNICIKTWGILRVTESLKLAFHLALTRVKRED